MAQLYYESEMGGLGRSTGATLGAPKKKKRPAGPTEEGDLAYRDALARAMANTSKPTPEEKPGPRAPSELASFTNLAEQHGTLTAEAIVRAREFEAAGGIDKYVAGLAPEQRAALAQKGMQIYADIRRRKHELREKALANPEEPIRTGLFGEPIPAAEALSGLLPHDVYPGARVEVETRTKMVPGGPERPTRRWKVTVPARWSDVQGKMMPERTEYIEDPQFQAMVRREHMKKLQQAPSEAALVKLAAQEGVPVMPFIGPAPETPLVLEEGAQWRLISKKTGKDLFDPIVKASPSREELRDIAARGEAAKGRVPGKEYQTYEGGARVRWRDEKILKAEPLLEKPPDIYVIQGLENPETKAKATAIVKLDANGNQIGPPKYYDYPPDGQTFETVCRDKTTGEFGTLFTRFRIDPKTGEALATNLFKPFPGGKVPSTYKEPLPDLDHFQSGLKTVFTITRPGAELPEMTGTLEYGAKEITPVKKPAAAPTAAPATPAPAAGPTPTVSANAKGPTAEDMRAALNQVAVQVGAPWATLSAHEKSIAVTKWLREHGFAADERVLIPQAGAQKL